jgi:peptide methionine sulfoxide reductase msrA/msrB
MTAVLRAWFRRSAGWWMSVPLAAGCSSPAPQPEATTAPDGATAAVPDGQAVAYFAGGCFWGVEHFLEKLDGVHGVESGYMGGHVDDPSYDQVSAEHTGHVETVRVRYDPSRVGYEALARRFFEIHDPTQADGQGPDLGPQYLSVVFYGSADEKATGEKLIALLAERGYDVATTLRPASEFWPAEDYHQDYYATTGKRPYCHTPVDRFGD